MASCSRPYRGLLSFAWIVFVCGCSSSRPGSGREGGPADAADKAEPWFDGTAPVESSRARLALLARFLADRRITVTTSAETRWVALGDEAALVVTVKNGGAKRLTLLGRREVGGWPLRHEERARTALHVVVTQATLAGGLQEGADTLFDDDFETLVVDPGTERSIRIPLALSFAHEALAASALVRAEVHPLALELEGEPERVATLPCDDVVIRFGPPRVAAAATDDPRPFDAGLADDPELLVAAALHASEGDPAGAVGRLMTSLPGFDARARRARLLALEWITGRHLGDSVERWRGWWQSAEGMNFGRRIDDAAPAGGAAK